MDNLKSGLVSFSDGHLFLKETTSLFFKSNWFRAGMLPKKMIVKFNLAHVFFSKKVEDRSRQLQKPAQTIQRLLKFHACNIFSILSEQLGRPVSSTFALLGTKFQSSSHGHVGSPHKKKRNSMRGSIRKCRSKPNLNQEDKQDDEHTNSLMATPLSRSRGKYEHSQDVNNRRH